MTSTKLPFVALLLTTASAVPGRAQDAGTPPGQGQMSPAEQAIMEKYMKAGTPGPEHQQLAKFAGKWKMQVTAWMAPGAPPEKNDGTAEFKTVFGGRYLQQEVKGTMAGQPYEGMGLMGYDNVMKERFATWADSMSTGILVMRGKCPADAKKCSTKGQTSDAVAGKMVTYTETTTFTDDNHFSFEMHGPGPGGKQFKMMEIVYTRE
ncbi:MAG TPA: DUF1579 domain-containing protein [Myxococcales bacterium]|nr:DUF1579 domain-containing protein [Myxococcales bacterium]